MRRFVLGIVLGLHLVPLWAFRFLPTEDGPSHVLNALFLQALAQPGSPAESYFEVRPEPVPNLTSHVLLSMLTRVLPPLAAEKVLASVVVAGLALSLHFFLASFGAPGPGALLGFLLLFNRCFFLGFYNYLLSLALALLAFREILVGEATRERSLRLGLLLSLAWLTHLIGFAFAVLGLLVFALDRAPDRRANVRLVALASLPGLLLTGCFLWTSGFVGGTDTGRVLRRALAGAVGGEGLASLATRGLHRELFAVHAGHVAIGALGLGVGLLAVALSRWRTGADDATGASSRRGAAVLAAILLAAYLLAPDSFGAHGSLMKARLAPLPFLVGLVLLPIPSRSSRRLGLGVMAGAVVLLNVSLVGRHVAREQGPLQEFTAATTLLPSGTTLLAVKPKASPETLVDPRAAAYYCLAARAICLSDYEPGTRHFPIRFKPGVKDRIKENRPGSFWAGAVLGDGVPAERLPGPDEPYREVFRRGGLRLFLRLGEPKGSPNL